MIPVINIKWDEAVNAPPFYQVVRYRQTNPTDATQITTFTPIASGSANYTQNDNAITEPVYYNKIWKYKVVSLCADAGSRPIVEGETIVMTCDLIFSSIPTSDTIPYSFHHLGGDVNRYEVKLFDSDDVQVGATQTKNPPFGTSIIGSFTGLTGNTDYTVKINPIIVDTSYTKECTFDRTTEPSDNHYSILFTNGASASNVKLYIGNDASAATNLIYDGSYSGLIENTSSFLPAVNANVKLVVTHGIAITTGSCNGTPATPTGAGVYTMQWTAMNGDLVLTFTAVATYTVNWSMDRTGIGVPVNMGDLLISKNGITIVNANDGTYQASSFSASVGDSITVTMPSVLGTGYHNDLHTVRSDAVDIFVGAGPNMLTHTFTMPAFNIDVDAIVATGS